VLQEPAALSLRGIEPIVRVAVVGSGLLHVANGSSPHHRKRDLQTEFLAIFERNQSWCALLIFVQDRRSPLRASISVMWLRGAVTLVSL
jgi:hypothetical protein